MKPVSYLQTDPRWKGKSYAVKGEQATIGSAGCGPTAVAMVVATLKDNTITPADTAAWMLSHGYKAYKAGTYYTGIVACLKAYGIPARQLNQINNYHNSDQAKLRESVKTHLRNGRMIIACMGKGTWTSSGHFVLAWSVSGGTVFINDPASTKPARTAGSLATFLNEAKYFWLIEATTVPVPTPAKEEEEVTEKDIRQIAEETFTVMANGDQSIASESLQDEYAEGVRLGITDGSRPGGRTKREESVAMDVRVYHLLMKEIEDLRTQIRALKKGGDGE